MSPLLRFLARACAVVFAFAPARAQVTTQTVDAGTNGDVGQYASMALVAGNPAAAYYNATDGNLLFARSSNATGNGTWAKSTIAAAGDVGRGASLAIVGGNPAVAYCDVTNGALKFSRNSADDGSGTWSDVTVDAATGSITDISLVVLGNGLPAIAYYDSLAGDLKFATNASADGSGTWSITTIASTGDQGKGAALAVLPNGRPAIAFFDFTNRLLKFAANSAADGAGTWTTTTALALGVTTATVSECKLVVISGTPAISCSYRLNQTDGERISYVRNTAADGSGTWTHSGAQPAFPAAHHSLIDLGGVPLLASYGFIYRGIDADVTYWTLGFGTSGQNSSVLGMVNGKPVRFYREAGDLWFAASANADASANGWSSTKVDTGSLASGATGEYTSLAVVGGTPAISYYEAESRSLRFARNSAADGSGSWTLSTVDSTGSLVGWYSSLSVLNGNPAIVYQDASSRVLIFTRNSASDGSGTWTTTTVDSAGDVGAFPSVAVVGGNPAIAYHDATNDDLKFARNSAADGSGTWAVQTVDSVGNQGNHTSLAVVGGTPAISYRGRTDTSLKFARNSAADGTGTWTIVTVDDSADVGQYTSLVVAGGRPAIGYYDATNTALKFARNSAADGSGTWTLTTVDDSAAVGEYARMALVNGRLAISYYDATSDDLKLALNSAADGSGTWTISTVDAGGDVGRHVSLAAIGTGAGIAYQDVTTADLKFALVHVAAPEISVEQPALTVLASGATKDLGSVALGASGTAVTFTIRNSGDADLTGLALTKDGAHPADFAVGALSATTVAPGGTATFTVTFTPGAVDFRTAVLHLASNDADENPYDLRLTGRGTSASLLSAAQQAYAKPGAVGTTQAGDQFGYSIAMSGNTVVVGAPLEDSSTTGVNSTPNESASDAGAAYVFVRSGATWTQQAYLKASNTGAGDSFGWSVAISGDTVVVGAYLEDSSTNGVNTTPNNSRTDTGAAYVFVRSGTTWTQQAYLKADISSATDWFGYSVAISGDTAIVAAPIEDGSNTGVNSTPNESASGAGAVYAFVRSGTTWTQQAYLKSDKAATNHNFGYAVAIDGDTLLVGSGSEDGSNSGVNSTYVAGGDILVGAAYIFQRTGSTWVQQAYLKASNPEEADVFGRAVAISGDTVAIGMAQEDSSFSGVNGTPDEASHWSGAVYVFARSGGSWTQQAMIKAGNNGANDRFGYSVALTGETLLVGAPFEDSGTTGVNSTPNESAADAGAVYLFTRSGTTWSQRAYIKSGNTGADDYFGLAVAASGLSFVVGAYQEDSSTTGLASTPNETAAAAGAAYFFLGEPGGSAPTISDVADTATNEDTATSALAITLADTDTAVASLALTASSSNTTLVPDANIVIGGSGANRTVTITPVANLSGTATITLTVSDGENTATDTFVLTVNAVNDAPTITNVADTTTPAGVATSALAFTVADAETAAASLTVTATSSNTTLVPNANLVLGGSGASRTLTVTPAGSLTGTATITVTVSDGTSTATDTFVVTVTTNVVTVANANNTGAGSLRQALVDVPAGGTITFDPTFFAIARTITLSSTLTITKSVTLTGPGSSLLTISGNNSVRCLLVNFTGTFELSGVTIANGRALNDNGGGLELGGATATLRNCVFSQNFCTFDGGAIRNGASLTVIDCTFTGNRSDPNHGQGGGAIQHNGSFCSISGSTFVNNSADVGGALQVGSSAANTTVTNCTFSGNTATQGGAVDVWAGGTFTNCTIVGNTASNTGGVRVILAPVKIVNTCVAGNLNLQGNPSDLLATNNGSLMAGSVNNLIGSSAGTGLTHGVDGNQLGVTDPLFAPLGNYGGATQTRPPYATSLALNAGTATGAPATDQRGIARPQGAAIDIGAVEQAVVITPTTVAGGTQNSAYTPVAFSVTGGTSPYTWALLSGALPAGMSFNTTIQTLSGTPTASGTFTFALSATDASGFVGAATYTFAVAALTPPTISDVADLSTAEDTATSALAFTVADAQTAATALAVTAASSNQTLVPDANLALGGSGANRTVTVTPAANQTGTATITLTVTDGDSMTATDTFVLTVTAVNDPPTISDVADISTNEDTATAALAFTIGDLETTAASLTVTRASSNTTLIPLANVVLGGSGANRTVTVTPVANQSGTATITLTVSDGTLTATDTFVVTVNAVNDAPTISNLADTTTPAGVASSALAFTVGDLETAAASLTVTATSSDTSLVPNANLVLGGSGASRTLTVTPAGSLTGTATITVTVSDGTATASDTFVLTVTTNVVTVANANNTGAGSLRQALVDVPAGGTITFDPTFFATPRTITLSSTLAITKSVTVTGPGTNQLTISGNNSVRCFSADFTGSVALSGLTIANGRALNLNGGGLEFSNVVVTLTNCVFRNNFATFNGGAVRNNGSSLTVIDCTFDGNTSANAGSEGGAVGHNGTVCSISGSTFINNNASSGGGLSGIGGSTNLTVTNCTFSGNTATFGGAVAARSGGTFVNCTMVGNSASGGGGLYIVLQPAKLVNTCVAGNLNPQGNPSDLEVTNGGSLQTGSINNLVGSFLGTGLTHGVDGNQLGVTDPLFAPLGSYGGLTQTRPPYATSPALNAGTATGAPATDQRGVARPQGAAIDIGAVEQSVAITPATVAGGTQNSAYTPVTFTAAGGTSPYTWALASGALPVGMSFNTATQTLSGTPTASGSFTFALSATDASGFAGTASYTFAITALTPPTISNVANLSTAEDTPTAAIAFTVGDTETAAASLTVTATSSNQTLVPDANLVLGGSGASRTVTATPAANLSGTATITLTVTDGDAMTATDTFVLTVTAVNDAPTISDVADISTNEDTATSALAFTLGDLETAAASLTVTRASSNTTLVPLANVVLGGSGANRTVTVTPAANQSGTATITLTVSDGSATATDTFVVTVNAVNDAPTISNVADVTVAEDTATAARAVTVGDIDTAVASLSLAGSSSNPTLVPDANITFGGSGASRTVTVTPAANQTGTATITLTVSDGALTATDTFVVTVTAVNDAPTISDVVNTSTAEDTATSALAFTVGDAETAVASLTVTASSSNTSLVPNANLVLGGSGANRTVTATPATNASGTATITLTVSDGTATATDTFVLTVTAVNDAPTITGIADTTTNEDTPSAARSFTIGDLETAAASLTLAGTSSNTTLIPNANIAFGGSGANRTVTVTPAANQSGTANITGTVSDGTTTTSDVFVVTVTAVNDAPTLTVIANTTVAEDTATSALAFTIDDVETAAAALTVTGSSSNTTLVPNANLVFGGTDASRTLTVTPAANRSGTATITVNVSDGTATGTRTFLLTVTAANDAPLISDLVDLSIAEDTATTAIPFTVDDVETAAAALTVSATSSNTALVPNGNLALGGSGTNRTLTATPAANQSGTSTITVTVSDGTSSTSDTFALTVTAVNDAPTISNLADRSTNIDTSTGAIAFTIGDVETAAASLTVTATSSNLTVAPAVGLVLGGSGTARTLTVTPAAGQTGTSTITVTVDDGTTTTSDTWILSVVNGAPTVSTIADTSIAEDNATAALAFTVADNETPAGALTLTGASDNTSLVPNAAIVFGGSGASRTVTVTPAANQSGTATITVTASDGTLTGSTSFLLTVTAVNDVPAISNLADTATAEDTPTSALAFTVADLETAAGALTVSATSSNTALVPNANLVFGGSGANRTLTATPAANASGTATITVTVSDDAATTSDTFVLTVNAVNDTPTLTGIADTTISEDNATSALAFTIGDVETATTALTVTATSSNTALVPNGALALAGTAAARTLTATPAANQSGTSTITVTVSDGTATASDTFVLTVTAVNDAPTISNIADRSTALNTATAAVPFTLDDLETAAASLTVTAVSSNPTVVPNANLVLGGSGANRTFTATPATNQTGAATITVTVSDGTASASDTFVLTVSNGAPTISTIADLSTAEDTPTAALAFTVSDTETPAASLIVSGTSDNLTLVPNANLAFGGSGANRTVTVTPDANQSGTATITVTANDGLLTGTTSFVLTVTAVNDAPTIGAISDVTTAEDTATPALAFTIGDLETAAASLTFSATSSNPSLVPNANLALGGSGASRTLIATPAADQSGTSTITVTVSDGTTTTSDTFVLTVTAVNDAPTIGAISDTTIAEDSATSALAFTIGDLETVAASLTVTATSSNTTLVPNAALVLGGADANRTITATPAAHQSGMSTITVTVSDGTATASSTFDLTVTPVNDAPTIANIADRGTNINTATSAIAFTIGDLETAAASLTVSATSSNTTLVPNANLALGGSGTARTITLTPATGQTGTSTITMTVSDGALTATDAFVLTVNNGAPTIGTIADLSIAEDAATSALAFTVSDTETPAASLVVTATSDNLTLVPNANLALGGSGVNRTITVTPAANQFGTATITLSASDGVLSGTESFLLTVTAVNDAPTISDIADTSTAEGIATSALAFTLSDLETATASLVVSASSSNPTLVPNTPAAFVFGGSGANRTLTVTPAANQSGSSTITVTVSDGALTATDTFVLTVTAGLPTVTSPTRTALAVTTATLGGNVTADGGSPITARGVVFAVTATNANPRLLGTGVIELATTGTTGVFTVPATGLAPLTAYSYVAYATNAAGTAYSATDTFTTPAAPDTTPPTATITIAAAATLKTGDTAAVTIVFSEPVSGFANADLTVANGTLTPVATTDNITFTATLMPAAAITAATNVITLDNTGVADFAANAGVGTTTSNNYAIDTAAPVFTSNATAATSYRSAFSFTVTATDAATLGASGLPAGLTFTPATGVIAGTPTVAGTFPVALTATDAVGNVASSTLSLTVARIPLTVTGVTAASRVYDATTTAALDFTAAALVGILGGDTVTLGSASATGAFADKLIGTAKPVAISGLALAGAAAANYSLTSPSTVASITAKALAVSGLTFADKVYDGSTAATVGVSGSALLGVIAPDVVTLNTASATAAFADATVGSGKSIAVSGLALAGADAANYTLTPPTGTASITAIPITTLAVTIGNLSHTYDGSPKSATVNVAGGSGTVSVTYNGSPSAPVNAGTYAVAATVTGTNAAGSASGTLTIATAAQTLAFSLPTLAINVPITLSATASSRLPVAFALVSGHATLSGATLTVLDANPVTVRATQAGNANYDPVFVSRTASAAGKLAQTIAFAAPADRLATAAAFTLSATASSGLPVSFTVVSGPALLAGSELTLTGATGAVVVRAAQAGDATYEAAPDVTVTFLVTPAGTQIFFGHVGDGVTDVLALVLAADGRSGTLVGTIPGTGESFTIEITLDARGDWSVESPVLATVASVSRGTGVPPVLMDETPMPQIARAAQTRTFGGHIAGGILTGSISGTAQVLRAGRLASTGPAAAFAGGYQVIAPATADSALTFVAGATGQLYVLATAPAYVVAASGTIGADGAFTAQSAEGATLNGTIDAASTAISGVLQRPGFPPEPFFGLGRGVRRTDRLINLSSRVRVGPASGRTLITGFVVGGGDGLKRVLLRAVGPALGDLGVAGALANPRLQLFDGAGKLLAENDDWSGADLTSAFARLGAFALAPAGRDAALLTTLAPGAYTMHVIDGGENGVALAEIYDASVNPSSEYQRLINISSRGEAGTGADVLIGGFVVTGNFPKRVLVRGIGPALGAFGLTGTLADPRLKVYSGATVVGENDNWSAVPADATAVAAAARATGAFALTSGSRDAAVILTLAPGAYTAQVAPADGVTPGVALVEIYEVP